MLLHYSLCTASTFLEWSFAWSTFHIWKCTWRCCFLQVKKNYEVSFKTCNDRLLTATFWNCMTRCLQFSFVDKVRTNETRQLIINEMLASLVNSNWKVSWDRNARKGVELIVFFSVTVGRSVCSVPDPSGSSPRLAVDLAIATPALSRSLPLSPSLFHCVLGLSSILSSATHSLPGPLCTHAFWRQCWMSFVVEAILTLMRTQTNSSCPPQDQFSNSV